MKIVRNSEVERFENASSCIAYEYQTGNTEINLARVEINGRYPLEGSAINREVTELVYVERGEGKVGINDALETLEKGDLVLVEKGDRVWWEGDFTLLISCAPAWTPEQYGSAT